MGIPVDLEKSTLLRETFDRIRKEAAVETLMVILQAKFSKPLPVDIKDRLSALTPEDLKETIRRAATAASIKEVLARVAFK